MDVNHAMDDGLHDLSRLPVPVQTFLWRQIAPFVRPKLGKLHEANCMVSTVFMIICLDLTCGTSSFLLNQLNSKLISNFS